MIDDTRISSFQCKRPYIYEYVTTNCFHFLPLIATLTIRCLFCLSFASNLDQNNSRKKYSRNCLLFLATNKWAVVDVVDRCPQKWGFGSPAQYITGHFEEASLKPIYGSGPWRGNGGDQGFTPNFITFVDQNKCFRGQKLREGWLRQIGWIFEKSSKGPFPPYSCFLLHFPLPARLLFFCHWQSHQSSACSRFWPHFNII